MNFFVNFQLLEICYQYDPVSAMGLVEKRNKEWGERDSLELSLMGNCKKYISTSCCQEAVDLNWRRGMIRAPTLGVLIANLFPFLIYTRIFR